MFRFQSTKLNLVGMLHGLQVKSQSVIQKLKELQQKWQGTCQSVHAHLHAPVSSSLKTEPSPLSQKLANGSLVDGKTHSKNTIFFQLIYIKT